MKTKFILAGCLALLSLTFVGTAAMRLLERGELDLDEPVRTYVPALRLRDEDVAARVTMRHLLTHTGGWVGDYSTDAVVMPPNAPSATTKETFRNIWKDMIASASSVSWKATRVEVAKSGDMAYVSGTYEVTVNDASGKPVNDRGKYLEVWKKQADGKWKCGADIWNSDLPVAPAEKK